MKRITAMLMAGLLAAGALSGCGSGADGTCVDQEPSDWRDDQR